MRTQAEKESGKRQRAFQKELLELQQKHFAEGLTLQEAALVMTQDLATTLDALNQLNVNPENRLNGPETNNS